MATVTIKEAQAKLPDLIHNLTPGDEVVITENDQPVAKLVAEGQGVQVRLVQPARKWGEGILRSAGGWADRPEMDAILEKIHQDRKLES